MTSKITISLPDDYVLALKQKVADGEAGSVSAFIKQAIGPALGRDPLLEWLDELDRIYGPPDQEADEWAQRMLSGLPGHPVHPDSPWTQEPSSPSSEVVSGFADS